MTRAELIEALETAQGADAGLYRLFEDAFLSLYPEPSNGAGWRRFWQYLGADAYLDAAMMLVPEGWDWGCGGSDDPWGWVCPPDREYDESMKVVAAASANALAAACLRAGGE